VTRDFTEAKLADDALRESEGRLRVAVEAAQMGTWLWRIPTDEQILDDMLRRLMDLAPNELAMDLDSFLRAVPVSLPALELLLAEVSKPDGRLGGP
jgi:two-component system CheB/CheR fusion protein